MGELALVDAFERRRAVSTQPRPTERIESDVDIFEQDGAIFVEIGLAGVRTEHLMVNACGSRLLIWACRPPEANERRYRLRERRGPQEFTRELTLPPEACLELATATFQHGLLRVCVPFARDEEKPVRPIPVEE